MTEYHDSIPRIFTELTARCNQISVSTIQSLLKGKMKVSRTKTEFSADKESTPKIEEAEAAFMQYTCIIFTAFRGGYTLEQNIERNRLLKADMEALGMKYRPVTGCYREADWEYASIEYCYFVYNDKKQQDLEFFTNAYLLAAKYEQDSLLYKRAGINRAAFLVATTEAGRRDLGGDIRFAGQLFLRVPDVDAWTDCSDGRIAFQLRGMILIDTPEKKIKLGEGNLFDTDSYGADGLALLYRAESDHEQLTQYLEDEGLPQLPVVKHIFKEKNQSLETLRRSLMSVLNKLRDQKCRRIGIYCSASVDDSELAAATITYDTVCAWTKRNTRRIDQLVLVDTHGHYCQILTEKKLSETCNNPANSPT